MKHILIGLVALCLGSTIYAQTGVLTPESLWQLERVHSEQVSPDGKTVIYLQTEYSVKENKGKTKLYKVAVGGGSPQMIYDGRFGISDAQWRPDGKKIGFICQGDGSDQLWEMNPDGTELKQASNAPSGMSNFTYGPQGRFVSFSMDVKLDETLKDKHPDLMMASGKSYDDLMVRHWNQWTDDMYSHLFMATYSDGQVADETFDVMANERFDAPMKPFGGREQVAWHPGGEVFVYVCKKKIGKEYALSTNSDLYLFDVNTRTAENISEGMPGYENDPSFSPDGKWLAWVSMARDGFESDQTVIWTYNLETRVRKPLTQAVDQSFSSPQWSADGKTIYAVSGVKATHQIFAIDVATGVAKSITSGVHDISSVSVAGDKLVGSKMTMSKPTEIYVWDIKTGKETQLSHANDQRLSALKMGKVEARTVKTTDAKDMLVWVIYPPDFDPTKKYPTLLYCQGGPQSAVSQFWSYRWNFQLMAANGYIVVAPNRRGLPSFGKEWNDAISKDWGGQAMKDYLSAIDNVSAEPYVDKNKLGAVGASYGGYSVYYLAGIHDKRFKCFISHCGLFNLESWYLSTEELFFARWDVGGPYWQSPGSDAFAKHSPHRMIDKWDTPIMVIHNELDYRVPMNQGLEAYTAAQMKGIPSRLLYFPDEGHWVSKPQNSVMWHREFYSWLDQWLK